jgi:hypothetical protein
LLLLPLLLRELLLVHLIDPLQLMRHNRADTPRVVIVIISPPHSKIVRLIPLPPLPMHGFPSTPRRGTRSLLHERPQYPNLALDSVVLRKDALKCTYFVKVVSEGCWGVVKLRLEIGEDGGDG